MPRGLPVPQLPSLALVGSLLIPALSLAFVGLVQGAAISSSVPSPDGEYPDASGDFRGQGIANIGAGIFQGMLVGGSMSATSIVTAAGALSRLALLVAAATMIVTILLFADLVGYIAMPALAGLLIVVGVKTFKPDNVRLVLRTGPVQATVMLTTFVLTMIIPLQYAVLIGVGLSIILYVARQSNRIQVKQWVFGHDGTITEQDLKTGRAAALPAGLVCAAPLRQPVLRRRRSVWDGPTHWYRPSRHTMVIISLRGKEDLGSTFINVVTCYAERLHDVDSILMLAMASPTGSPTSWTAPEPVAPSGLDNIHRALPAVTESTRRAPWRKRDVGRPTGPGEVCDT